MNKVVTINLNGRAYQLEATAYDELRAYLEATKAHLRGNPDRDEIMADFEQAVADKCDQYLGKSKTVVTESRVKHIISEMGPAAADESDDHVKLEAPVKRQFYQIHDRAIVCGVCAGIAAYLNLDVTVVRLAVILLTFITGGLMILIYIALALLLPVAKTPEQKAAAMGQRFNAEDIIDRAKAKYGDLADGEHWQKMARQSGPALKNVGDGIIRCLRVAAGALGALCSFVLVALGAGWIASVWSIALTGRVFGFTLDPSMSPWLLGAFVTSAAYMAILPVLVATVVTWRYAMRGHVRGSVWWPVVGLGLLAIAIGAFVAIPLGSTQIQGVVQNHQGQLNLGAKTICVGDNVYCHRPLRQKVIFVVPAVPTPLTPPAPPMR